jgi:hypothetical protein
MRVRLALGLLGLLLVPALLGAHCAEPDYRTGAKCSEAGTCPPGQQCSAAGQCLKPCGKPGCTGLDCGCSDRNNSFPDTCVDGLCHIVCNGPCEEGTSLTCDVDAEICRIPCHATDPCVNGATCRVDTDGFFGVCVGGLASDGGLRDGGGGS